MLSWTTITLVCLDLSFNIGAIVLFTVFQFVQFAVLCCSGRSQPTKRRVCGCVEHAPPHQGGNSWLADVGAKLGNSVSALPLAHAHQPWINQDQSWSRDQSQPIVKSEGWFRGQPQAGSEPLLGQDGGEADGVQMDNFSERRGYEPPVVFTKVETVEGFGAASEVGGEDEAAPNSSSSLQRISLLKL